MTNSNPENILMTPPFVVTKVTTEQKQFALSCQQEVREKEKEARRIFEEMLQFCQASEIMLAYNGGKDCTVVLHMLESFLRQLPLCHFPFSVLYIQCPNSFPEVDCFVQYIQKHYPISLIRAKGATIKQALQQVICEMPHIKCVVLGSRRTDPYCANALKFQATDPGWPPLMRCNPILNWTCKDVWSYIFLKNIPYCHLYAEGYTSLGSTKNTKRNPVLKDVDINGHVTYRHAYELQDDELERAGRF